MNINWKIEEFSVEKGIEDHLFRILQESVSNTLRHAKATLLEVLLIKRDGFIILRVTMMELGLMWMKIKPVHMVCRICMKEPLKLVAP